MKLGKTAGGILLVAGTTIGAGMLALPITTGAAGFSYSMLVIILSYLYMLVNLFLVLESNLYTKKVGANIITNTKERLGPLAGLTAWVFFLLLMYSVAAAYTSAGGGLVERVFNGFLHTGISHSTAIIGFVIVFAVLIYFGTKPIDQLNRLIMIGLIATFVALVSLSVPHISLSHYTEHHAANILTYIPIVVLSFTSHIIVPSMKQYFEHDIKQLKLVLFVGSLIPLILYGIWQAVIIGIIPLYGENGLISISHSNYPVATLAHIMHIQFNVTSSAILIALFSFFAVVSSFLAVALSLNDFLADGLNLGTTLLNKLIIISLSLIPPLLFALFYPKGFVIALNYAGLFVLVLYGILPILSIWQARYREKLESEYQVPGGKPLLTIMLFIAALIIALQFL